MGESRQQDSEASKQQQKSSEFMHASDELGSSTVTQSGISSLENGATHGEWVFPLQLTHPR